MQDGFSNGGLKLVERIEVGGEKIYLYEFAGKRGCTKNAQ
jgi:hypothetical protein